MKLLQSINIKKEDEVILTKEIFVDETSYQEILNKASFGIDDYNIIIMNNLDEGYSTMNFNCSSKRNKNGLILSDNFSIYGVCYKIIRTRTRTKKN
jgi:hypothetical protein